MSDTRESVWLLQQFVEYNDARTAGLEIHQFDVFTQVANRVAQLSRWIERHGLPEPPDCKDPAWVEMAQDVR